MAGGIDWFRWHHGTVTDQKFPLIAKRSGATVAEVIAVWACVLEAASMSEVRGCAGEHDFEAMDCALGLAEGRSEAIYQAMQARELVDEGGHVEAWSRRQPKREREDDNSTARVQAFRERQRHETPRNANTDQGTQDATEERAETPRGEERREEETPIPRRRGRVHDFPPGFDTFWAEYPKKAAKAEAAKAFARLKADDSMLCRILSALAVQKQSPQWLKDGGQFIPNGATWLNGRRWEDELPAAPAAPKAWEGAQ